jgi:hypothetical protein
MAQVAGDDEFAQNLRDSVSASAEAPQPRAIMACTSSQVAA